MTLVLAGHGGTGKYMATPAAMVLDVRNRIVESINRQVPFL
jgi:hypothetical protein